MDVTLDAGELEGMSEADLRKKYDSANKGSAGVPGGGRSEDFSDMVAKEMAKKKQKMEQDKRKDKKGKDSFKF